MKQEEEKLHNENLYGFKITIKLGGYKILNGGLGGVRGTNG